MTPVAYILIGILLIFGPHPATPASLQPKPKTAELSQAQQALEDAKARQAVAEAKLASLEAQRQAVADKQLDYSQQMVAGTVMALGKIAPGQVTPEVKLATEFATRAEAGLEAYRGKLDPAARAEMEHLVGQGLSAVQAERDALKVELALKDMALSQTITEKSTLQAQILTTTADVKVAQAQTQVVQAKADTLVKKVSDFADNLAKTRAEAGSWQAYFWWAVRILAGFLIFYVVAHILFPNWAASWPGGKLEKVSNFLKNVTTSH